jgi:hypothetical protein
MDTSSVNTESKFRVEFHSCLNNNKVQRWVIWHKQLIMKAKVNLCAGNHYVNFYFEFWNASFELLIPIVLNYRSWSVQSLLLAIPPRRKYAFQPLHIVICTHCVTISSALYSFWYFIGSEFRRQKVYVANSVCLHHGLDGVVSKQATAEIRLYEKQRSIKLLARASRTW